MRQALRLVVAAVIWAAASQALAADFPWFGYQQFQGWAETAPGGASVKVVPYVVGPDVAQTNPAFFNFDPAAVVAAPKPEITTDRKLKISYRIVTQPSRLPEDAWSRIATISGKPLPTVKTWPVQPVQGRYVALEFWAGDRLVERRDLGNSNLVGDESGAFYVRLDDYATIDKIRAGDFQLVLIYDYRSASFSALNINFNAEATSSAWVKAYREVIQRKRKSSGRFLFFSFSSSVQSARVKESIEAGGGNTLTQNTEIVATDATDDQLQRVEKVLGYIRTDYADMMQRHTSAVTAALLATNPNLAAAHNLYAQAIQTDDPGTNEQLLKVLEKLSDSEALQFMAAGFQSGSSSASGYGRYDLSTAMSVTSTQKITYSDYVVRTAMVRARNQAYQGDRSGAAGAIELAYEDAISRVFGGVPRFQLTPAIWTAGVADAIRRRNLADVEQAFDPSVMERGVVDPNRAVDADQNRLLHLAARTGHREIIAYLLRNGADPERANRLQDTPIDAARLANDTTTADLLQSYAGKRGTMVIRFRHPGLTLGEFQFLSPQDLRSVNASSPQSGVTEVKVVDYPMLLNAALAMSYRVTLSPTDYQQVRFQHTVVASSPNSVTIQGRMLLQRSYRIPEGQTRTFEQTVALSAQQGPQVTP